MTDFYREVVISLEWLFCVMAFFHLHLANMCFRLREIVSTNKMINISKNLGRAYGKAGIRNRNWNPNLRNKTWRRFCLKSVTNNKLLLDQDFSSPHYIYLLLLYFLLSHFLRTAQNFSSRISYTRERYSLGSWLTWVLLPLPPFPHNEWNTEPF